MSLELNRRETTGDCGTISYQVDGGNFIPFAKVVDITPNKISVPQVDTTVLASVANESQAGTPDFGEVSITILTDAANSALITSWITAKKTNVFQITMNDYTWEGTGATDSAVAFKGWVKEFSPLGEDLTKDKAVQSKLTLKITGVVELTPGKPKAA